MTAATGTVAHMISEAARPIPLLWPLSSAIAVNPLWDLRQAAFPAAVSEGRAVLGIRGYPDPTLLADAYRTGRINDGDLQQAADTVASFATGDETVATGPDRWTVAELHDYRHATAIASDTDRSVAKWCAAHLAGLLDPGCDRFFPAWRSAVERDRQGRRSGLADLVVELPPDAAEAVGALVGTMRLDDPAALTELTGQLGRMPGWAAHAKWFSGWAGGRPGPRLDLADYLAARLASDLVLLRREGWHPVGRHHSRTRHDVGPAAVPDAGTLTRRAADILAGVPAESAAEVWLHAYEIHHRDRLLRAIPPPEPVEAGRPADVVGAEGVTAQVVCCIDVRSEGLRRHLEIIGGYETFGFAGFFGIPARVRPWGSDDRLDLLPVLVQPSVEVEERPADAGAGGEWLRRGRAAAGGGLALDAAGKHPLGSYILAEAAGLAAAPIAAVRTASPSTYSSVRRRLRARLNPPAPGRFSLDGDAGPDDGRQADLVESMLRAMGLVGRFAPVVVLCGHGSTTENNPYGSALDCGACGGARGATSARLAASILNRPAVRAILAGRGIDIPASTAFVAAEHDTSEDVVRFFDEDLVDEDSRGRLAAVERDMNRAAGRLAGERLDDLPGRRRMDPSRQVTARAADWAELQPEWGLAGNAAFLIGPRRVTRGVDLGRRCFLHSYQPESDPDGSALEAILAGPVVVGHWINAQYYFSTVDPEILGAGDKVAHNVVAGTVVTRGAGRDLALGLPRQSVFDGERPYHEPMRLLVLIAAPRRRIDETLARTPVAELVAGRWVHLAALDEGRWWTRSPAGGWSPWNSPADT